VTWSDQPSCEDQETRVLESVTACPRDGEADLCYKHQNLGRWACLTLFLIPSYEYSVWVIYVSDLSTAFNAILEIFMLMIIQVMVPGLCHHVVKW
jgi:hypothetical protein